MRLLTGITRCVRKSGFFSLLLLATFTLGTTLGFAGNPNSEIIQATYAQAGRMIGVTLIIYDYSTQSDMRILSQAFEEGKDQGLVTALSKTKSVGRCSINGALSYDIAFIQMVVTPTGRQITFITNRPLQFDELKPGTPSQSYDLEIGQFDLNDTDNSRSTGFLYPASKLVIDKQGELHFDLAGSPWSLVHVLDSKGTSGENVALGR